MKDTQTKGCSPSQGSGFVHRPVLLMPVNVTRAAGCGLHAYGCETKRLLHQTLCSNGESYCTLEVTDCPTSTKPFEKASCHFQKKKSRKMTFPPSLRPQLFQGDVEARELLCRFGLPERAHHACPGATCLLLGHTRVPSSPEGLRSWHHHLSSAGPASSGTPIPLPAP